jgi:hypothetical protein
VRLRWPDGAETEVVDGGVTGLGRAGSRNAEGSDMAVDREVS